MKRILIFLMAIAAAAGAVEWDVEQIPDENLSYRVNPRLALDEEGNPYILFIENMEGEEQAWLRITTKESDEWVDRLVSEVTYGFFAEEIEGGLSFCSFAVDESGNSYVAVTDFNDIFSDTSNLYIAIDTSGSFEIHQLTNDDNFQWWPVIALSGEVLQLGYIESVYGEEIASVKYGSFSESGEFTQEVIDSAFFWGLDLIPDSQSELNYFYTNDTGYISQATRGQEGWTSETISDTLGTLPSAIIDNSGKTHVAYRTGESLEQIRYLFEEDIGSWFDEYVAEGCIMEAGLFVPCIAADPQGNPYISWVHEPDASLDIYFAWKTEQGWIQEPVAADPENDEWTGSGRFFVIDAQGYGHLAYCAWDYVADAAHLYYAKSRNPLAISEDVDEAIPVLLDVSGSTVRFSLPRTSFIHIELYDASGRLIVNLASGTFAAGDHSVTVDQTELASGVYFVYARIASQYSSTKLIVTR